MYVQNWGAIAMVAFCWCIGLPWFLFPWTHRVFKYGVQLQTGFTAEGLDQRRGYLTIGFAIAFPSTLFGIGILCSAVPALHEMVSPIGVLGFCAAGILGGVVSLCLNRTVVWFKWPMILVPKEFRKGPSKSQRKHWMGDPTVSDWREKYADYPQLRPTPGSYWYQCPAGSRGMDGDAIVRYRWAMAYAAFALVVLGCAFIGIFVDQVTGGWRVVRIRRAVAGLPLGLVLLFFAAFPTLAFVRRIPAVEVSDRGISISRVPGLKRVFPWAEITSVSADVSDVPSLGVYTGETSAEMPAVFVSPAMLAPACVAAKVQCERRGIKWVDL